MTQTARASRHSAAVEGLGNVSGGTLADKVVRLRRLRDELVRPQAGPDHAAVFGRLLRGDADTCADDAIAVVKALRPELLPAELRQGTRRRPDRRRRAVGY